MSNLLTIIILLVLIYNISSKFKEFVDDTFSGIKSWFGVKKKKEEPYRNSSKKQERWSDRYDEKKEDPFAKYTRQKPIRCYTSAMDFERLVVLFKEFIFKARAKHVIQI